ncbi:MAG: tetratricopeptide repeat protein [Cyanobacteria bacterium J06621_12]
MVNLGDKNQSFLEINQKAFKELLTFVDFADQKLNIAFAEVNFAQDKDLIISKLIKHPNCKDIQFEILDLSDPNLRFVRDELVTALKDIKIAPDKKLILLITGLEKSIGILDEYPEVLVNLNYIRDDLSKTVSHPTIFFLPEYALTRLAKYAPDFWAWSRKAFCFKTINYNFDQATNNTIFSDKSINSLELIEKNERVDFLLRLLSEYEFSNKQNFKSIINIYKELGLAFRTLGDYKRAIYYNQKSLKNSQNISYYNGEINALIGLGNTYDLSGEYQKAISCYQSSLKIARNISDRYSEAVSLNNLRNTYHSLNMFQLTIKYCQQALKIALQIQDNSGIANALGNLGIAHCYMGKYKRAIDYYQQSLEISQQIDDRHSEANSLTNLGNVYNSLKDYRQAIDCYQRSLENSQQIGDIRLQAASFNNLGNVYYQIGEYQQTINYYQQSLAITQKIGDRGLEANTWFNLGNSWRKLEEGSEAKTAFENAMRLFQAVELVEYAEDCDRAIQKLEDCDRHND